ncbi:MAG: nicotinate-nucleotide--dimethylbenzimidazole phosphoribosyltransferase [Rhizobiaceae bacterium]|nr:nicotinate-nucleotide--dimethylbenzimidazole phosphoribosyltransferase [Rhizobiaceae bacterium]
MLENYQISPINQTLLDDVQAQIDIKTKPPGSLGRIERLAQQMAGAQSTFSPAADPAKLMLFAADHGMVVEGVSAWPSEVTTQMVANFLNGGAASNVFAKTNGLDMVIVDAGIIGDLPDHENLVRANITKGTNNAMHEDAMTAEQTMAALEFGADLAAKAIENGTRVIALGEMGIGNTSSATLLCHAIEGIDIDVLTGPGAGLDAEGVNRKAEILKKIAQRRPGILAPMDALSAYGGLEIAMMAGALIGTASKGGVTLVDGFIASSAALVALKARPEAAAHTVFAHRSKEPGHRLMLEAIGEEPLLDLDLRLGEGTGALLAFPLLRNACAMLADMATFESAGVSGKE